MIAELEAERDAIAAAWAENHPAAAKIARLARLTGVGPGVRQAIIALARKLLVALWRHVETGLVPDGAVLKAEKKMLKA